MTPCYCCLTNIVRLWLFEMNSDTCYLNWHMCCSQETCKYRLDHKWLMRRHSLQYNKVVLNTILQCCPPNIHVQNLVSVNLDKEFSCAHFVTNLVKNDSWMKLYLMRFKLQSFLDSCWLDWGSTFIVFSFMNSSCGKVQINKSPAPYEFWNHGPLGRTR